jgi:hypothetical protein
MPLTPLDRGGLAQTPSQQYCLPRWAKLASGEKGTCPGVSDTVFVPSHEASRQACRSVLGVVLGRWEPKRVEGSLLSRRCGRALESYIGRIPGTPGLDGCICMHFVRDSGAGRLRSDLLHVVLTATGADGSGASTLRCLCGQVANPHRRDGVEAAR